MTEGLCANCFGCVSAHWSSVVSLTGFPKSPRLFPALHSYFQFTKCCVVKYVTQNSSCSSVLNYSLQNFPWRSSAQFTPHSRSLCYASSSVLAFWACFCIAHCEVSKEHLNGLSQSFHHASFQKVFISLSMLSIFMRESEFEVELDSWKWIQHIRSVIPEHCQNHIRSAEGLFFAKTLFFFSLKQEQCWAHSLF